MNDAAERQSEAPLLKKRRIHKRTLAIVFCLALLPWFLVAMPGLTVGGGGTTGLNVSINSHGWPFAQLRTTHVDVYGDWVNGKFIPGRMPPNLDLDELARKHADNFNSDLSIQPIDFDLRFYRVAKPIVWKGNGFWSDSTNWPGRSPGWHWSPNYSGLALNFIVLAVICGLVIIFIEYRIRSYKSLFNFSLRTLLVGTAIAAIFIAWTVREFNENQKSLAWESSLKELDNQGEIFYYGGSYKTRLPLAFSQLLNHGKHPWGHLEFFFQVEPGTVEIRLDDDGPVEIDKITKLVTESGHPIQLDVTYFGAERRKMLEAFNGLNVEKLSIDFESYDWVYEAIGDKHHNTDYDDAKNLAKLKLHLDINFPNLKELSLELDSELDQVDQLKAFEGSQSLERVEIYNLSTTGAEYILQTKNLWPSNMHLDFTDEVPVDLKDKLEREFQPVAVPLVSVIPVVG